MAVGGGLVDVAVAQMRQVDGDGVALCGGLVVEAAGLHGLALGFPCLVPCLSRITLAVAQKAAQAPNLLRLPGQLRICQKSMKISTVVISATHQSSLPGHHSCLPPPGGWPGSLWSVPGVFPSINPLIVRPKLRQFAARRGQLHHHPLVENFLAADDVPHVHTLRIALGLEGASHWSERCAFKQSWRSATVTMPASSMTH